MRQKVEKCDMCSKYSNTCKSLGVLKICKYCLSKKKDSPVLDWASSLGDDISCICGNTPHQEGFYPCLPDGLSIEPNVGSGWENHFKCAKCHQIFRDLSVKVEEDKYKDFPPLLKPAFQVSKPWKVIEAYPEIAWKALKTLHDDKEALKEENKLLTQQIEDMRSKYNIL